MRRSDAALRLLAPAVLVASCAAALLPGAAPADGGGRLRAPERLPPPARELLRERMRDHRADLAQLSLAVVLLEREEAARLAQAIADGPRLARPGGLAEPGELNGMSPPRFFELQDRLRAEARELAKAARSSDDATLGRAFGRLSETCVACHSVYLNDTAG